MNLDLSYLNLSNKRGLFYNLGPAQLAEMSIKNEECIFSNNGALVVSTGKYTGRSPKDKFIVKDRISENEVWWGKENRPLSPDTADRLYTKICRYLDQKPLFVQDCFAGASREHRLPIRVITERAWHSMFARNMFLQPTKQELASFSPGFTVIHAPGFKADPNVDGTNSEAAIIVSFACRKVFICGTEYAGEIKKSIFSVLNFLLPAKGILGMHCSANHDSSGNSALFFGLSGTGKTTLSADPRRSLIGDDEHGWCDEGVFNFEGGCYAKVIRLSEEDEPEIFATTKRFGTVLENVYIDKSTRELDLFDDKHTENTRASYDISQVSNADLSGIGNHPKHVVMLTCDAFGVLPPISRLTPEQAMYHFISGYTAKVAGTERGITEPTATFSACFGAPFMARHPNVYAKLLGEKMRQHYAQCWLVNTGWTGGANPDGSRIKIKYTRNMLNAALSGELDNVTYVSDPNFGLQVPTTVPGVPSDILTSKNTWTDKSAYDKKAKHLVELFRKNFEQFSADVDPKVLAAQPG